MSAANSRLRWARLSKFRGEITGLSDRAAVELSGAVGGADKQSDDALHVDLHGLFGEAILEGIGAFYQLAAVEVADPVAVDERKAEAFGYAQCLGCIGAGAPDHLEGSCALGFGGRFFWVERLSGAMIGSFMSDVFSEARGAGCCPAQPSGAGKRDMGVSGPAQGQGVAGGARKVCGRCCPRLRAATDAGLPCDEALLLPQRGAPAAFDRVAPMSDRSKTDVLCRQTIWYSVT